MNEPAMAATLLIPRAKPRWFSGKASVRMALELANRKAPPTPWKTRMMMSHRAPARAVHPGHRQQDREDGEDGEAQVVHPDPAVHVADPAEADHQHRRDQQEPHQHPQEVRGVARAPEG